MNWIKLQLANNKWVKLNKDYIAAIWQVDPEILEIPITMHGSHEDLYVLNNPVNRVQLGI